MSLSVIMKIYRVTSRKEGHKTCYSSGKVTGSYVRDTGLDSRMNRGHRNGGFPHFSKFIVLLNSLKQLKHVLLSKIKMCHVKHTILDLFLFWLYPFRCVVQYKII
jgi:hypothetical protein